MTFGGLGAISYDIVANDMTAQGLDSAGAHAKKIQKTGLAVGASMTAIGFASKTMADNINASYLSFDDAMAQVKSLGGVTNEQMEMMRLNAIAMSQELPISAKQIADGFYMMRSAGFDAARVIEELPAIANMAVAGNMEMADAVSATTMVLDSYGEKAGSTTDITNVLVATVQEFKTTLPELQQQMSKNIGVAESLGVSFEELAAMSGMLKKDFVGVEEAGTALKTMMLRLTDESTAEALEELGVSVKDANGNFVGMQTVLDELSVALAGAEGNVQQMTMLQEIFGSEGVRAAQSLVRQKDALAGYTAEVGAGVAVQEALDAQLESTASKLEIAKNRTDAAKISMGEAMAPATILAAEAMASFGEVISGMPEGMQTVVGTGLKMSEVFLGLGPAIMGVSAIMPMLQSANLLSIPGLVAHAAAAWAMITPYLMIAAPILAVVGILYALEKRFGVLSSLMDMITPLFEKFTKKIEFILTPLKSLVPHVVALKDALFDTEEATEAEISSFEALSATLGELDTDVGDSATAIANVASALSESEPIIGTYEAALVNLENASKNLSDAQAEIGDSQAEVDRLTSAYDDLKSAMDRVEDLTESLSDKKRSEEHAMWSLKDAEEAYAKAVEEHGKKSDEAARADLRLRDAQDRLDDIGRELLELEDEKQKSSDETRAILEENNAKSIEDLASMISDEEDLLQAARDEYLIAEQKKADAAVKIEELKNDAIVTDWISMKKNIEKNPVQAQIHITKFIEGKEASSGHESTQERVSEPVLGSALTGMPRVPETGLYRLHAGEAVIPANQVGEEKSVTYNITITGNTIKDDYDIDRISDRLLQNLSSLR